MHRRRFTMRSDASKPQEEHQIHLIFCLAGRICQRSKRRIWKRPRAGAEPHLARSPGMGSWSYAESLSYITLEATQIAAANPGAMLVCVHARRGSFWCGRSACYGPLKPARLGRPPPHMELFGHSAANSVVTYGRPDCSSCIWGLLNTPPDCYSSSLVRKSAV